MILFRHFRRGKHATARRQQASAIRQAAAKPSRVHRFNADDPLLLEALEQRTLLSANATLSAIGISPTQVAVSYNSAQARIVQIMEKGPGETFYHSVSGTTPVFATGAQTIAVGNLKPESTYSFRLLALGKGISQPYVYATATTRMASSPVQVTLAPGQAFSGAVARFSDADADASQFTSVIYWGDGTQSAGTILPDGAGGFAVNGAKTYANARTTPYNVLVTVNDADGSRAVAQSSFTVGLPAPSYVTPVSNPSLPSGMNVFTPPIANVAPAAGTPVIAASNPMAGPDESLTLTGSQFTSNTGNNAYTDTTFLTYGQTSAADGTLTPAQIQDNSASGSMVTISTAEPTGSMYYLWPTNSAGIGAPIAINKTTAWWMGNSAQGSVLQTASLFGENLANAAGQSWIYMEPTAGGAGEWATVTGANPYRVDFTIPADLANGTYNVWANNGMGGAYGWAAPLKLTVVARQPWDPSLVVNIQNYGAVGDGVTDDGPAIQRAIAATQPGGILYFAAGTYLVGQNEHLDLPANITLTGESQQNTTIMFPYAPPADTGKGNYLIGTRDGGGANVTFQYITIQSSYLPTRFQNSSGQYWERTGSLIRERGGNNFTFTNANLFANSLTPLDFQGSSGLKMESTTVVGLGLTLLMTQDVNIDHVRFYQRYEDTAALIIWGTHNISITNCTVQDYENWSSDGSGTGFGRFIEDGLNWSSIYHQYVANNTTIDMAARTPYDSFNAGEQVLMEGARDTAYGNPSAATSNTVTMDLSTFNPLHATPFDPSWCFQNGMNVIVTGGTGIGQLRTITSIGYVTPTGNAADATSVTLTLDQPWTIIPDSTTHVDVTTTAWDSVFYQNTLQNSADAKGAALSSSSGFEVYTGGYGLVFDSNTTNNTHHGVMLTSGGNYNPVFFNEILNNQFNNSLMQGVVIGAVNRGGDPDLIGTVVRGNNIFAAGQVAINLSWLGDRSDTATLSIIEHNVISNSPMGMAVFNDPDVLVYDNTFTGSTPDAVAIAFQSASPAVLLVLNKFQNYVNNYSGTVPANAE